MCCRSKAKQPTNQSTEVSVTIPKAAAPMTLCASLIFGTFVSLLSMRISVCHALCLLGFARKEGIGCSTASLVERQISIR